MPSSARRRRCCRDCRSARDPLARSADPETRLRKRPVRSAEARSIAGGGFPRNERSRPSAAARCSSARHAGSAREPGSCPARSHSIGEGSRTARWRARRTGVAGSAGNAGGGGEAVISTIQECAATHDEIVMPWRWHSSGCAKRMETHTAAFSRAKPAARSACRSSIASRPMCTRSAGPGSLQVVAVR